MGVALVKFYFRTTRNLHELFEFDSISSCVSKCGLTPSGCHYAMSHFFIIAAQSLTADLLVADLLHFTCVKVNKGV